MKEKYYEVAKTITKWKLDNPFENWLGYRADKSEFWKRLYVLYYRIFDNKYYCGGIKLLEKEIARQNLTISKENFLSISFLKRDMIYCLHRFGVSFLDYFVYKFYEKKLYR